MRAQFFLLTVLIFLCSWQDSFAQILMKPPTIQKKYLRCYTVEQIAEFRKTHPNAETDEQFETWLVQKIKNRTQNGLRPANANYTIPVIFHIVHNGEAVGTFPNLNATIINQQLLQLNKDYANGFNSPYAVAAATGLQFVLAQKDEFNGILPEAGIDRINRNDFGWTNYNTSGWTTTYLDATVKPFSIWDADKYLNIWLIPDINNGTTDLLGYSTFPSASTLPGLASSETSNNAGVVVLTGTVGSAFSPNNCGSHPWGLGKTLAHEIGHFFGLRHIWGDANCGEDYCNDTPVHFDENFGEPIHPKPNACGTADEMFENYMDYTDDVLLNTFTTNQVDRMQTVMLNSPRRVSLATSSVGAVVPTGSNRISFINCLGNVIVTEAGANTTYPRVRNVSFTLNVEDKATGNATVNITATGTAIAGTQYQLLTPSVNFVAGDNSKPINIRILDNAKVDDDRTIILNYTITGTGVTAGTTAQTLTVNLYDDDNMRVGQNTINLLDEHFENPVGSRGLPTGWSLLTTASYVNGFVASINGDAGGTGLAAHISNDVNIKPNTYTKGSAGAAVLQTPVIDVSAVQSLGNLSFKYKVAGLVGSDEALLAYNVSTAQTGPFYYYGSNEGLTGFGPYSNNGGPISNSPVIPAPGFLASRKFNIDFYWETGAGVTGTDPGFNLDDVVLEATPYPVESLLSSSYTYDLQAGTGVSNFKSTNNKAIFTVVNPSQAVTGVTAQVTEAGTGMVPVTTSEGSYLRTAKVIQISPTVANSTVTYQGTLYFTAAELANWGASRLTLKILKVKDGVSLSGILNSSNAELITPTVVEDLVSGYISYTGNFTGFSQFMLVSPLASLPVSLISFQATASQKNIELVWSTSQETNNRGFMVERSLDGNNFKQVGWVNGNGTTSVTSTYTFIDNYAQPSTTYYYRIRQVDADNRQTYSVVRNARIRGGAGISIAVTPNPVTSFANLFITGTTNKARIELVNLSGQRLLERNGVDATNGIYNLPISGFAKGAYNLVVYLPEGAFTKKIIIQ